jgi:hypothetical protein
MAEACDQCRRVPAGTERGERHLWIKVEAPKGIVLFDTPPPEFSGMLRGVSTVMDLLQFCTVGCASSFFVAAGQRITHVQMDSAELMRAHGALPEGIYDASPMD